MEQRPRAQAVEGGDAQDLEDANFESKLVDVVGLYLNPPEPAVVFGFDEKTQCQALDRTQASLPLKRGRSESMTHDYKRNGTTDLLAALNVGTGEVIHRTPKGHVASDVLSFFKWIDAHVPDELDIQVVLDNLSADEAPPVAEWLAHPKRARWQLQFTPNLFVVAEPGRGLVQAPHPTAATTRRLQQRRRPRGRYRPVGRALERRPQAVHLEEDRRRDHRQGQARPRRPHPPDQIRDAPRGSRSTPSAGPSATRGRDASER